MSGNPFTIDNVGRGLPEKITFQVEGAKDLLQRGLEYCIPGEEVIWFPEYDKIADWLTDNKGKGLLMYGSCGVGKSLMGEYIIPRIIAWWFKNKTGCAKIIHLSSYRDLNEKLAELKNFKLLYIDDVGQEEFGRVYGNTIHAFADIIDQAEKNGNLLILTSNLSKDDLEAKYGDRVMSRLYKVTKSVYFNKKDRLDMRKAANKELQKEILNSENDIKNQNNNEDEKD